MLRSIKISNIQLFSGSDKPRILFFLLIYGKMTKIVHIYEQVKVHAFFYIITSGPASFDCGP